jgi:hypothetical protein
VVGVAGDAGVVGHQHSIGMMTGGELGDAGRLFGRRDAGELAVGVVQQGHRGCLERAA